MSTDDDRTDDRTDRVGSASALVHGPGWPSADPAGIVRLLEALDADPSAAVAILVQPLTDTIKVVDRERLITATLDRERHQAVLTPIAVRPSALPESARGPLAGYGLPDAGQTLSLAAAAGCRIVQVPVEPVR